MAQLKEQVYQIVEFDLRVDLYDLLDDEAHAHWGASKYERSQERMMILLDSFQRDLFFASEDHAKHKSMRLTITRLQLKDIIRQRAHIQGLATNIAKAEVDLI